MVTAPLSNEEFGRRIGVTHSMASRIRSGDRLPSVKVMTKISEELDIPLETLVLAHRDGPKHFGRLIRAKIELLGQRAAA